MFVYAKDREQADCLCCISMVECKASPWRWEFVKVAPGQEAVVEETMEDSFNKLQVEKKAKKGATK